MQKSIFEITKMDCPSEENLIRMKLDGIDGIRELAFDLGDRRLTIFHEGPSTPIEEALESLKLGSHRLSSQVSEKTTFSEDSHQKKLLWTVLIINFAFFIIEMTTGLISRSMGLVADSLDMLADAFVYGISLFAVGGPLLRKKKVARVAGYFQLTLAALGFMEVLRRFLGAEQLPDFSTMIVVSILALIANSICLYLLQKSKSKEEAHMKASMIFTSNDIIINLGVITAGLLVLWTQTAYPDLVVGTIVFLLVVQGALRILKMGK
jgi:Co/Zn/Cd efflux system component